MRIRNSVGFRLALVCLAATLSLTVALSLTPADAFAVSYTYQWSLPGASWSFTTPTGVAVDSANNYYVLSGNRIKKYTAAGQFVLDFGTNGVGAPALSQPTGIAIDSRGNTFVCDNAAGGAPYIAKFNRDGVYISTWAPAKGSGDGQFNDLYGIAVDSSDNVYVSDSGNARIQKFTNGGMFITKWSHSGPYGIAIDSADNLWIASTSLNQIRRYTSSGSLVATIGGSGTAAGKFSFPTGVSVDASGNLFVADANNQRMQKLKSDGTPITAWGSLGSGPGKFMNIKGIALDRSGDVVVADTSNNRLQKFTSSGAFISEWKNTLPGQLKGPRSVCADPLTGDIYVLDRDNRKVLVYSRSGLFMREWTISATNAWGIALDPVGFVYVADYASNTILKFTTMGVPAGTIGTAGSGDGQLSGPRDLAVDIPTGNVLVTEATNRRVQVFSSAGGFVRKWGSAGTGSGQFTDPAGITIDATGSVYVCDPTQGSVQKFTGAGAFVSKFGAYGSGPGQLLYAQGLAVDPLGNIHVVDTSLARVTVYTSAGVAAGSWGTLGFNAGQFRSPMDIAFDSYGNPLVANYENGVVVRFGTPPITTVSGNPAGWSSTDVTLTLSATGGIGTPSTYYSLNGATTQTYSGSLVVSAEGTTNVSYWSADESGSTETSKSVQVLVDKSGPSTPSSVTTSAISQTSATVAWAGSTDSYTGVVGYRVVSTADGSVLASVTGSPATLVGLKPGRAYAIAVVAVDGLGNLSARSAEATFSTPAYPVGYVPAGDDVTATLPGGGTAHFAHVDVAGTIGLDAPVSPHSPPVPYRWVNNQHYDIHTDAVFTGAVAITLPYGAVGDGLDEGTTRAFHYVAGWQDVTTSVDTTSHAITFTTTSFSEFGVGAQLSPPTSTPASSTWTVALLALVGLGVAGLSLRWASPL